MMKTKIEYCPNPDCVVINTDRRFECQYTEHDKRKALEVYPWLSDIDDVIGVDTVSTGRFHIQIMKGTIFSWDNILPVVERILQREFPNDLA
jgi:hypothetical protein